QSLPDLNYYADNSLQVNSYSTAAEISLEHQYYNDIITTQMNDTSPGHTPDNIINDKLSIVQELDKETLKKMRTAANSSSDLQSIDVEKAIADLIMYKGYNKRSSQKFEAHPLENQGQEPPDESSSANLLPNIEMIHNKDIAAIIEEKAAIEGQEK